MKKKILIALAVIIAIPLVLAGGYLAYAFLAYSRVPDNQELTVANNGSVAVKTGEELSVVSWNLGFGAYSNDYTFFMDGGQYSRAFSKDAVKANIAGAAAILKTVRPDFMLLQEIDTDSTRSYHVNEKDLLCQDFASYGSVFAFNYNSPYLFYPLGDPIGKSVSGILTLSQAQIESSLRRSLPVETGFMKFLDLDRCYSVTELPMDNGKTLCLYNLHLSAYTSDGTIATEQLKLLLKDMSREYEAGNYVIAGGDFNKDLYGDSGAIFGVSGSDFTWAQPFPTELLPKELALIDSLNREDPIPSCRNTDIPYTKGKSFVLTVDGFIVSANVSVSGAHVLDEGFRYSDHNPVQLDFSLNP